MSNPRIKPSANKSQIPISAWELFRPSIAALQRNIITYLIVVTTPFFCIIVGAIIATVTDFQPIVRDIGTIVGISLIVAGFILGVMAIPAFIYTQIMSVRDELVLHGQAFSAGKKFFWRFIGLNVLTSAIYSVAAILFVVPLFFAMKNFLLAPYYMIDQDLSITEALKKSSQDSQKYSGAMWGLIGVLSVITVAGYIPIIGLLAIVPGVLYMCAPAVRYQEILVAKTVSDKK